jgi:small subunit ribosomal protein S17
MERNQRKILIGTVVSDKMDKTITVAVESKSRHPLYNKLINTIKKVSVHDEENIAKTGDVVKIMGTRPTSKTKRFRLVEIIKEHIEI